MRLTSVGAIALSALAAVAARRSQLATQEIEFKRASTGLQDVVSAINGAEPACIF